ncbi:MAG: hypothetical protein ABI591_15665 [Kofleriaceae bacterium]
MTNDDDALKDLAKGLPPVDLDSQSAQRIAQLARRGVDHGPPRTRWVLPILVGLLVTITLVWALFHVYEALQ